MYTTSTGTPQFMVYERYNEDTQILPNYIIDGTQILFEFIIDDTQILLKFIIDVTQILLELHDKSYTDTTRIRWQTIHRCYSNNASLLFKR